jgi:hypothetical protein
MGQVTVAYSEHRLETLPHAAALMHRHETVFLEEPFDPAFSRMLAGKIGVDTYIAGLDTEYPEFSRQSCRLFRKLASQGIRFYQVEPFLDELIQVHEMFAAGQRPTDIAPNTARMQVYLAEKRATKTLISFYRAAVDQPFDTVLEHLKEFARADAARFRLRDHMRVRALSEHLKQAPSAYIEAGTMHLGLHRALQGQVPFARPITHRHVMAAQTLALTGRSYLMGPGDVLTLRYIINPRANSASCERLAARSLIFSKITAKEELLADDGLFPHLRDQWQAIQTVNRLDVADCKMLFNDIRAKKTMAAKAHVDDYRQKQRL